MSASIVLSRQPSRTAVDPAGEVDGAIGLGLPSELLQEASEPLGIG